MSLPHGVSNLPPEIIGQLEEFCRLGIHSLKIEGRMKSAFYVATVTRAYREVLDAIAAGQLDEVLLARVRHRKERTGRTLSVDAILRHRDADR